MFKTPLAALIIVSLAAPGAATVRALPARAPLTPGALPALPLLGATRLFPLSAAALAAPSLSPTPSLLAAPKLTLTAPAAASVPAAAVVTAPAALPFASAAGLEAPLAAASDAPLASPESGRASWEKVWTGSLTRPASGDATDRAIRRGSAASTLRSQAAPLAKPSRLMRLSGMAALPLPAAAAATAAPGWLATAVPFLQGGGLLVGAYAGDRISRWAIGKLAGRFGWSKTTVAMARLLTRAALWGGALGYGLTLMGISDSALFTTLGGSGAAMALAARETLGNLVHGVHFLVSRPFTVGSRVVIDDIPGTVHELTLRYVIVKTGLTPPYAFHTYSELNAKAVTVTGTYQTKGARLRLGRLALPHGLLKAVKDATTPALWKPAVYTALGVAALYMLPLLGGWVALKGFSTWFDAALPYAHGGLILFLGRSVAQGAHGAIARLAARYGWAAPATTLVKLAASALIWGVAGSFALNALGVTWGALATTLSVSTIVLGIAVNDYVAAVFQAFLILTLRPFEVGDRIAVGKHEGEVVDITFQHVVLKKDDASYILLPYASVKGFRSGREYGHHKAP